MQYINTPTCNNEYKKLVNRALTVPVTTESTYADGNAV